MAEFDRTALACAMQETASELGNVNPRGEEDWLNALMTWRSDELANSCDPSKMAEELAQLWIVGTHVKSALPKTFKVLATQSPVFPYTLKNGELSAGLIVTRNLRLISLDPREIAHAIIAEVHAVANPEHNLVLFRRLIFKGVNYKTSFGLARVD